MCFEYEWSFSDEETRNDVIVDDILLIDRINELYLTGMELDYKKEIWGSNFEFKNQNHHVEIFMWLWDFFFSLVGATTIWDSNLTSIEATDFKSVVFDQISPWSLQQLIGKRQILTLNLHFHHGRFRRPLL